MSEYFSIYSQEIVTVILSLLVSIITTFLVHLLAFPKLILEEKAKLIGALTQKKMDGILALRECIRALNAHEELTITEPDDMLIPELRKNRMQTPSIFYSFKNLTDVICNLNDIYGECSSYIGLRATMHIIYTKEFLLKYFLFCKNNNISDDFLRWLSVPLHNDIKKLYRKIDAILIGELNRPTTKYYAKYGLIYNISLAFYGLLYKNSKLFKHIDSDSGDIVKYYDEVKKSISKEFKDSDVCTV